MQKWEYGFLTVEYDVKGYGFAGRYSQVHATALFNYTPIASYDYRMNKDRDGNRDMIYMIAFNKLGSMGWELVTYTLAYSSISNIDGVNNRHEKIFFKRLIE